MKGDRVIVCPKCGSDYIGFIATPELIHFGKYVCIDCGRFIKWVKAPRGKRLIQDAQGYYVVNFGKRYKGQRLVDVAQSEQGRRWLEFITKSKSPDWVKVLCEAELHDYEVTAHA